MNTDGDFVITWSSIGQDGSGYGIYAQRYNATGDAQGTEFRVNSNTSYSQRHSSVAMDANGDFVVTWSSEVDTGYGYGGDDDVLAQRYDATVPTIVLTSTSPTSDTTPDVMITATDSNAGIAEGEPIVVDVDLNNDGDYLDAGEADFATGTLTAGSATVTLPTLADGTYKVRARAYDKADNEGFSSDVTLVIGGDITAPTSLITALPAASSSLTFAVNVTGTDPGAAASGILDYDVYYSTGGAFVLFATLPVGSQSTTFTGSANTTYWFRSLARDHAGNVETKTTADTFTRIGDIAPPTSAVTSATPNSSGLFTVQMSGSKANGTPLTEFDVYVSIDENAAVLVGSAGGVSNGGGNYSGALTYQGVLDGASHIYSFYSQARDGAGNLEVESGPGGDVTATHLFAAAGLTATGIAVQNGANRRSFVQHLDVLFSSETGLDSLLDSGRIKVERFSIDSTSVVSGTGAPVTGFGLVRNGNKLQLDFGSSGLGGLYQAGDGFYRVLIDQDGNGEFSDGGDSAFEFHRLFGDANGDGKVDTADLGVVTRQIGQAGPNLDGDIDGNGVVNSRDRLFTLRQRGRKLDESLLGWLDD